ncbi:MAG: hypothetical protein JO352_00685 [Chloroflexi bacterium]|nr:hypothetical protein [Chloroflexota bacterium]
MWDWGGNWFGELGNGTTTNSTTPVQATGLTGQTLIAAGREHSMSATGSRVATTTYAYDKLYRLTGVAAPSGSTVYSYDPNGNRLSKVLGGNSTSYTYDKSDRILTAGSTSYTVNVAGNVTARGSDAFGFDQANRLTSATTGTGSGTYWYDGDGKRLSKAVAGVTTSYVYDVNSACISGRSRLVGRVGPHELRVGHSRISNRGYSTRPKVKVSGSRCPGRCTGCRRRRHAGGRLSGRARRRGHSARRACAAGRAGGFFSARRTPPAAPGRLPVSPARRSRPGARPHPGHVRTRLHGAQRNSAGTGHSPVAVPHCNQSSV